MEQLARYKPADDVPVLAKAEQLLAGRFVEIDAQTSPATGKSSQGDYCAKHAAANLAHPFGVTEYDSAATTLPQSAAQRRVNIVRKGAIARVKCAAEVKAGEEVYISGSGEIKKWVAEKNPVGRALTTAAAEGYAEVEIY